MRSFVLAAIAVLALASSLFAQEFRGTIGGAVTDPTGAMVPGAKVTVTEINTGTKVETVTDSSGHYAVPYLLPGDYEIKVQLQGFKEAVRKGVHLGAGEHPVIDARLDVGDAIQSVEVTADAPLLNSENASVGQTISTKEVEDLPTNGGTPMMDAVYAMGVILTTQPSQVQPFASAGGAAFSISGSPSQTNELMVDGSPNATWDGRLAYSVPQDAVAEVRVKAFDTDAGYGRTGGGTLNQVLKSGTNSLHGSLYEKNQPNNLVANDFFRNRTGLPVQMTHYNQYGGTAGGPVFLPKVFDGRNKLFWFFSFEGMQDKTPSTLLMTVPTDAEKQGDFSQLLKLASPSVIYDPYTAVKNGSRINRTAYANNKIPASQFNPIALKYMQFLPEPNVANAGLDGFDNFGSNSTTRDGYVNEFGRLDYNTGSRSRTYFNVRHTDYSQTKNNYYNNISTGSLLSRSNMGVSLDEVYMISGSNVLDVRFNFTRMYEDHAAPSAGFDPTQLGFPSYLAANSQYLQLPYITFSTNNAIQSMGSNGASKFPSQSMQLYGTWSLIKGGHTLKIGADARQYRVNILSYGAATGEVDFSANTWVRPADNSSSTVSMGQDAAELLLGLPTGGTYAKNASGMFYAYYGAGFVQDDWRVKPNLTLNLGVRFEHDFPYHERWGRTVNGFAFNTPSPLATAAIAAYNKNPIPQIPVGGFNVPGGLTFATPGNSAIYQNTSHLVSPRLGLAWTPERLHRRTVVRAGFGMFVSPISIATLQVSGAYSTSPLLTQEGFSQATSLTPSNDTYLTPAATLSNPFPSGIQQPAGSSAGLLTFAGQSVNFFNPKMKSPYALRWNFGIQHEISPNTILEIVYMGNHSVHLPVTYTQLNGVPRQYRSTLPVRDQTVITALSNTLPNPFLGLQTSTGTNATITTAQALAPYSQFPVTGSSEFQGSSGVVMNNYNVGSSYYESLNVRLQRRLSKGMSAIVNFMKSNTIDQTTWLNDTDPRPEHRISPFDRPNRFTTALTYDLPVGHNKTLNLTRRWADLTFGGWKVTTTYIYQSGAPLTWLNGSTNNPGDYVYFGAPVNLSNRNVNGPAFDLTAFDTKSADAFQYHIRTFSTSFPNLRADGVNEWDTSLMKQFFLGEHRYFQLRAEGFNVINHPVFGSPNTTASNSGFGMITTQANRTRMIQLVGRFVF